MPVPKRKRSRARKRSRFANKGILVKAVASCQNCNTPRSAHQVCKECGFYKGVKVLVTKTERTLKRGEVRQVKATRAQQAQGAETQK